MWCVLPYYRGHRTRDIKVATHDEFHEAVSESGHRAFLETLAAGVPVFYLDRDGLNVME